MGLLSNPKNRKKILDLISCYNNKLCVLCYVAGLVWFFALAYIPLNAGTYFSENALLPGLVENQYYGAADAEKYYEAIKTELKKDKKSMPEEWIRSQFESLGLDTYVQNYTFQYPFKLLGDQFVRGSNVYAILRAPRAASTESVVMSVPFRPPAIEQLIKTHGGLALMLSVAKHFRKYTYWSKDIIFLVTQHEHVGMQAWLDAFHSSKLSPYINGDELQGRSGSIQAAINLELPSNKITDLSYQLQGLNGQMPNLDLVNLITRLCRKERVIPRIHGQVDHYNPESMDGYLQSLQTMAKMMWYQAPGAQQGNHGLFLRYHIEALTLVGMKQKNQQSVGYREMGRIMEGVFRSLNNLLERFHQSFFFYLLPATNRYVSIGLYMPPFGLLAVGTLIKALALWIGGTLKAAASDAIEPKGDDQPDGSIEKKENEEEDKTNAGDNEPQTKQKHVSGLLSLIPVFIICWMFGLAAYVGPGLFIETSAPMRIHAADGLIYGCSALFFTSVFLLGSKISKFEVDVQTLKCVALIFQGLVLASLGVLNISLATMLAIIWVPVTVMLSPTSNRLWRWMQSLLLLLISPLALLCFGGIIHAIAFEGANNIDMFSKGWETAKNGLIMSVIDGHMLRNWAYDLFCIAIFPNWLMFWSLIQYSSTTVKKEKTE